MISTATRFAPSPTGRLHLGHAYSALMAHDFARASGGAFLLRIEDIDPGRSRTEFVDGIIEDVEWLGMMPDGEIVYQSERQPLGQPLDVNPPPVVHAHPLALLLGLAAPARLPVRLPLIRHLLIFPPAKR